MRCALTNSFSCTGYVPSAVITACIRQQHFHCRRALRSGDRTAQERGSTPNSDHGWANNLRGSFVNYNRYRIDRARAWAMLYGLKDFITEYWVARQSHIQTMQTVFKGSGKSRLHLLHCPGTSCNISSAVKSLLSALLARWYNLQIRSEKTLTEDKIIPVHKCTHSSDICS